MKKFHNSILFVLTFFISIISLSQTSTKSGNWNDATVWNTGVVPTSSVNVIIANGHTVTVTDNRSCASVTFTTGSATLSVNSNVTLTVSGAITVRRQLAADVTVNLQGAGSINCSSILVGNNNTSLTSTRFTQLVTTINNLNCSGNITLEARQTSTRNNNVVFDLNSGTLTLGGSFIFNDDASGNSAGCYIWVRMTQGSANGTLIFTGTDLFGTPDTYVRCPWSNTTSNYANVTLSLSSGTVIFDRNGNQNILRSGNSSCASNTISATFNNLTLRNTGIKTIPIRSSVTVNGTLSMEGTASLTNNGTLTYGASSTLQYKGSVSQTTTSVEFPSSNGPLNLTIDNSSGVTLHSARTIGGVLTLTNGVITTTSTNTLTLTSSLAGAVSGGSSTSYVNGPLDRTLAASTNYFYPVGGNTSNYRPINLNGVSVTGNPVVRVTVFETGASTVDRTTLSSLLSARNWSIEQISGTFTSANLVITESGMTNGIHHIGKSTTQSGDYVSLGNGQTVASDQISSPSAQGVGFYAIGVSGVALPIELYEFNGVKNGRNNYIYWITSSEQNTSHFDLQKSRDGETWNTITTLNAAGNSTKTINYNATDYNVDDIINYYRLQQHDLNGVYETYGPISINNTNSQKVVKYLNIIGQEIESIPNTSGVYIEVYSDGVTKLVWK